jgi:L-ascorbate metabolism protein UlaG (beta-lactamase superfamily)
MIVFQQIRNATVKLQYPGGTFMIDPWLTDACDPIEREQAVAARRFIPKPVCPLPVPAEALTGDVDWFLLTHCHPDHFSADHLPADAPLVCQSEADVGEVARLGFTNVRRFRDGAMRFGDIMVYRVEARHGENEETAVAMGPGSGFVFECPGEKTVYVAGDTVYYDGVRAVIERFQPDVIVVNACDARWKHGRLIMNAEDVMKTCACAPDSLVIASHMEAVSHAHLSRKQLREALTGSSYAGQVRIPEDGESIAI